MSFKIHRVRAKNTLTWKSLDLVIKSNKVLGVQGGNYTGKSNLVDIISLALYNRTIRSHTRNSIVTDGEQDWEVSVDFSVNSIHYSVTRGSKSHLFCCQGSMNSVRGISAVSEKMMEVLKCSYFQFINVSYLGQNRLESMASTSPSDRKNLIEPLAQLPDFSALKNQAKFNVAKAEKGITLFSERLSSSQRRLDFLKKSESVSRDIAIKERDRLRTLISKDQVSYNQLRGEVSRVESARDENGSSQDDVRLDIQDHLTQIALSTSILSSLSGEDKVRCPTCFSQPTIEGRKEALIHIKSQLSGHKRAVSELEARLQKLVIVGDKLTVSLQNLLSQRLAHREKFRSRTQELKSVNESLEKLAAQADAENLKDALELARQGLALCQKDLNHSEFWIKSLTGRGLPSYLLQDVVKDLSARVTSYLGDILPSMICQFVYADNGSIKCKIQNAGKERGFFACSGAEKRLIDLACSFALRDIAAEKYGSISDFILLDEVFDSLDVAHLQAVQLWISRLKGCTVLLITHNAGLKDWLPTVCEVKHSDSRGSYFV